MGRPYLWAAATDRENRTDPGCRQRLYWIFWTLEDFLGRAVLCWSYGVFCSFYDFYGGYLLGDNTKPRLATFFFLLAFRVPFKEAFFHSL